MPDLPEKYQHLGKTELQKSSRAVSAFPVEKAVVTLPTSTAKDPVPEIAAKSIPGEELNPPQIKAIADTMFPS